MDIVTKKPWKTTVIEIRDKGEWATFFVRESEVTKRENNNGFNASAEWTANTSFGLFGHYWSSMGHSFSEFITGISEDYLLSKIGRKAIDSQKVIDELKRIVQERRKENIVTKD